MKITVTIMPAVTGDSYSLEELQRAIRDITPVGICGQEPGDFLEQVALQARKNRMFDAGGRA